MLDKHIPTPSFGSGRDKIDQIIEQSDKQLKILPSKIDSDNTPLKSDTALQSNPAFQEMLQELENYDAVMASGDGIPPNKYDQAFFSALRTMLRECLFTKNPLMRKSHVQRIYSWFQQKRNGGANISSKQEMTTQTKLDSKAARSPDLLDRETRRARQMSKLKFPEPVESKSAIQTDYPDVEEELTPQKPRDDAGIPENIHFETMFTRPACERIKEYKMRNLRISQMRRQGIPMAAIRAAGNAVQKHAEKKAQDALGLSSAKMTDVEQSIRELWIRKRQEEEQERKSEQEVKEAMLWWAKNRARTEAEISRRQESIRFASQTALLHGRPESEPPTVHASDARGAKQASASAGEASPADDGFVANDEDEEDIEIIEDLMV